MKTFVTVLRAQIEANVAKGKPDGAVFLVSNHAGQPVAIGRSVEIKGPSRLVYDMTDGRPMAAQVWIETEAPVVIDGRQIGR